MQDKRLFWPDSMAGNPNGAIYVTASHIPQMKTWQGLEVQQTALFRFKPRSSGDIIARRLLCAVLALFPPRPASAPA